jgi:hypothetical protein
MLHYHIATGKIIAVRAYVNHSYFGNADRMAKQPVTSPETIREDALPKIRKTIAYIF